MSLQEITERVSAMGHAWEQFRQVNDARLHEIELKGDADPLYLEHLSRIGDALDGQKSRLDRIETTFFRPALELEEKGMEAEDGQYRKAFVSYLRKGHDAGLEALQTKTLSAGSDPDGGYLVTPTMATLRAAPARCPRPRTLPGRCPDARSRQPAPRQPGGPGPGTRDRARTARRAPEPCP